MKIIIDIPEEDYKHLAYAEHFKLRSYIESGEVVKEDDTSIDKEGDAE